MNKIKLLAKIQLRRNFWHTLSVTSVFILAFVMFSSYQNSLVQRSSNVGSIVITLLITLLCQFVFDVFFVGLYKYFLNQAEKKEFLFSDLLYGIRNCPDRIVIISFMKMIFTKLPLIPGLTCLFFYYYDKSKNEVLIAMGILLLVIGGIFSYIASLSLSQCMFIAADSTKISASDTIRRSIRIMNGHKEELFFLQLSFLPLLIVGFLSIYLGFFIIIPYYISCTCFFYLKLNSRIVPQMYFKD